ncbi:ArsR family transcriptional regulator [Blastococcus saxobsidens]|uniref:IclR-like helix-turn-helix domain-containing protein n=1 Tax=Blastococcus saxobsidens TaxID=138336 RepID=A0A4Q7Y9Z2_9ACTN|nr:ArsR family transcriptional regulator [Blastococcus saxobsidens]RZU33977.1 IclR-like helix-turn-helix domain-containing protein [Blastococcus saxobsidens]
MLTRLYLHPDEEFTVTDLAVAARIPLSTAHRELQRLVDAGLVLARRVGRTRLHRANPRHRAAAALTELLLVSFGPAVVVAEEFADLDEATEVVLFGSWAARHARVSGAEPADVDVLVVGSPRRADVYAAAERAQRRLRFPVNPVIRTADQWASPEADMPSPGSAAADRADALVVQVRQSPHMTLLQNSRRTATPVEHAATPAAGPPQ